MQTLRLLLLCLCLAFPALAQQPYSETGLPLPRFVSLKSDEANMRSGPGTRYPIRWVYKQDGLPLEIINEYGHWRQVRDHEGVTGWMHKGMLSGRRTAMVMGKEQILRSDPEADGAPMLKAEPGVIGDLLECDVNWCRLQIQSRKGWVPKTSLWGVYPQELVE